MTAYPILKAGTLAKPQTRDGRFRWLAVIHDPGPPHKRDRRIVLQGRQAGNPTIVRRDRVTVGTPRSIYNSTLAPSGVTPPPGDKRAIADAGRKPRAMKMKDLFVEAQS